jgi:chemotaxis family two-component system response regulator Rcp1
MAARRKIRLLVVEDNPAYLHLVQEAFSNRRGQAQWDLTVAKDGEEALQVLLKQGREIANLPDIVLLDWNLPKVTGSEVLRQVKEHPKLRRMPVLVFSSSEADEDIHAAYDNHANGYITKPDTVEALEAVVETIERFWIAVARLPKVARSIGLS